MLFECHDVRLPLNYLYTRTIHFLQKIVLGNQIAITTNTNIFATQSQTCWYGVFWCLMCCTELYIWCLLVSYVLYWALYIHPISIKSVIACSVFLVKGKTSDSNYINGREGLEVYERQPPTTQGEGRHHGVWVFFILQNQQNMDKRYQSSCWLLLDEWERTVLIARGG